MLNNPFKYQWQQNGEIIISDMNYRIKVDPILDTQLPIKRIDSLVVLPWTKSEPLKPDSKLYQDTFMFELVEFQDTNLVLINTKNYDISTFKLARINEKLQLNSYKPKFSFFGYSVGDTISKDSIEILSFFKHDDFTLISVVHLFDRKLKFKLFGNKIIYSINVEIPINAIDSLIDNFNNRFEARAAKIGPKKLPSDLELEGMIWSDAKQEITLTRINEINADSTRTPFLEWSCSYDDKIIQAVLKSRNGNK